MRTYRYDPGGTFRGWLRRFCHCRAVDLVRKRHSVRDSFLEDQPAEFRLLAVESRGDDEIEEPEPPRLLLLRQAEQIQKTIRQRVEPKTWQIFWQIAVEGSSIREAASELGMSYAAVFAAHQRVARMLCAEGQRFLVQSYPGSLGDLVPNLA